MTRNYVLVYYFAQNCVNYRDTGVSKNSKMKNNKINSHIKSYLRRKIFLPNINYVGWTIV